MPGLVHRGLGHALSGEAVVAGNAVELLQQAWYNTAAARPRGELRSLEFSSGGEENLR